MDNNNLYKDNNQSDENTNRVTNESASGTVGAASSEPMVKAAESTQNQSVHTDSTQESIGTETPQEQPNYTGARRVEYIRPDAQQNNNTGADFSRYHDTTSNFAKIQSEPVYIGNKSESKKQKAPKGRLSVGAVAAVVAICMVFSGGAAFGGTYLANSLAETSTSNPNSSGASSGSPSVIFQSYDNENKTAGTYEQVAEAVTPTVVEIVTESISTDTSFWGGGYITSGAGSGVIISADGLIITNNHVVEGANTITVTTKDGTEYPAELIGTDSESDIAVIKIDATDLPFALIGDSDELKVGQEVVAVGNPLGELGGTVTNGIISALSRDVNIEGTEMTLIQTNAAVNPGNSGGGLFNMYGELIGIVNAKSTTSSSGTSVEGIAFAIPVNTAVKVSTELVNYGYVRGKVMLGISYIDIDSQMEAMYYRVSDYGVYVVSSEYTDELKAGDRIVGIDDEQVTYSSDIKAILKEHEVGDVVTIKVIRGGQYYDVEVTLHEYVPTTATTDTSAFEDKASDNSNLG